MSSTGTDRSGYNEVIQKGSDNIRSIVFAQSYINPAVSNLSNPYGNTVRITFPYSQKFSQNCSLALDKLFLFNSWFNIQASFGNNVIGIKWPNGASYVYYLVTIPDGNYSIDTLSDAMQKFMFQYGLYLTDSQGIIHYYVNFVANTAYYRTTVELTALPYPQGTYTIGSNITGSSPVPGFTYPTAATAPYFGIDIETHDVMVTTNAPAGSNSPGLYSMSKTLGITPAWYPTNGPSFPQWVPTTPYNGVYTFNGQYPPIIESTGSVNLSCSLVNSGSFNVNPTIFFNFSPDVGFGEQIQLTPYYPLYVPITAGTYTYMDITLLDENLFPLNNQDPHINGSIIIRGI